LEADRRRVTDQAQNRDPSGGERLNVNVNAVQ
jgi:hypothetical protein